MPRDYSRRILAGLAFLMLAVRLVWIVMFGPQQPPPGDDHGIYHVAAQQLTAGHHAWLSRGSNFGYRAPLFFAYLAGVSALTRNGSFAVAQSAAALLGVLAALLLFFLIRRLGGTRAAWIGFVIRGLAPPYMLADTFVLTEQLFAVFFLLALLLVARTGEEKHGAGRLFLAGAALGCCLLTREQALLYPVLFGVYVFADERFRMRGLKHLAALAAGFALALAPWLARNQAVWGHPLPLSYTAGVNLHIGNNPAADGRYMPPPVEGLRESSGFGSPETDRWHRQQALDFIRAHPGQFARRGFKKVAWLLWPRFLRDDLTTVYGDTMPGRRLIPLACGATSALLLLCGIVVLLTRKPTPFWWLAIALIVYNVAVIFVAFGNPRFRDTTDLLLLAFLSVFLAGGRAAWSELFAQRRRLVWLVAPAIAYVAVCWVWIARALAR
jgi:4-amino-4-deoxy-L-arabinose transferase-like glycosyltransferase